MNFEKINVYIDKKMAYILATAASPMKQSVWHEAHKGPGMRYDHYHPYGINWYKNARYRPHVWYL